MYSLTKSVAGSILVFGIAGAASAQCVVGDGGSATKCVDLIAGQSIDAGDICLTVNGTNLEVSYTTQDGWELEEAHLWTGTALADMPQTRKGNPKIGNFPHNSGDITGATSGPTRSVNWVMSPSATSTAHNSDSTGW